VEEPTAGFDALQKRAEATTAEREILNQLLQPSSTCWSLCITVDEKSSQFAMRSADSGANRGEVLLFRINDSMPSRTDL
jgi:hypothetical protein